MNFEERTETRLNDHAVRLRTLETNDAKNGVIIGELCTKMDSLINWIKALLVAWCAGLGSFFVWYVQTLGK